MVMALVNVFTNVILKDVNGKIFTSAQDSAVTTTSKQIFDCVTPSGTVYFDCHSLDIIYLIT